MLGVISLHSVVYMPLSFSVVGSAEDCFWSSDEYRTTAFASSKPPSGSTFSEKQCLSILALNQNELESGELEFDDWSESMTL